MKLRPAFHRSHSPPRSCLLQCLIRRFRHIVDDGIGFKLNQPIGIDKPRHLHDCVAAQFLARICLAATACQSSIRTSRCACGLPVEGCGTPAFAQGAGNDRGIAAPCARISTPTVFPSGPSGAVPETAIMLPRARPGKCHGRYGLPLEMSFRMAMPDAPKTERPPRRNVKFEASVVVPLSPRSIEKQGGSRLSLSAKLVFTLIASSSISPISISSLSPLRLRGRVPSPRKVVP